MSLYRDLVNSAAGQGVDLNWSYKPYQPSPYGGGEGGNDPRENSIEKIAPTLTFNGVNYSYNPDTQTFSSGGDETKDPKLGWGRTYDLTTPEGTSQLRQRSRTELETAMPAILALTGVLGLGALGAAGAGGLGSLTAGEAVAGGIAPELIGGGLGGAGEAALTGVGSLGGEAALTSGALGGVGGMGEAALTGIGGEAAAAGAAGAASAAGGLSAAELAALGELGINTGGISSIPGSMITSNGAVISSTGELLGTLPASYGATTAGVGGSSGLPSLAKLGSAVDSTLLSKLTDPKFLASLGIGLGTAALTGRSNKRKVGPAGFQGKIDPNRLKYNRETGEYTVKATGEKYAAGGGITGLRRNEYKAGGRYLQGPGDGMSDNIRANIEGRQEARLADGEFVIPADVVSHIGNGSSNAGAKKLHDMMNRIRKARTGNHKQGKQIKPEKYLPA